MPTRRSPALVISLAMITSACSSPMKSPDIKQNPHPTKRFELIVTVDNAPGSFDKVEAGVLFQVRNVNCVPHHPLTGGSDVPSTVRDFTLTHVDDRTWKGYFFKDLLEDEDYFGLGVCHWDVMSVGPDLYVHNMNFSPNLDLWNKPAQHSETRFFGKKEFSNRALAGSALEWRATDDEVTKQPDAYFPMTVIIKEAMP